MNERIMLFDLETNALALDEITTIHTMTVYDCRQDTFTRYDKEDVRKGIEQLTKADVVVGHNVINFDIPVIKKFHPDFTPRKVLDTLVWARLVYADISVVDAVLARKGRLPKDLVGKHSLEAYGYRLGVLKGHFNKAEDTDWSTWSEAMSLYCEQDVRVEKALYEKLLSKNVSQEALELEHDVARIIKRQMDRGFYFNVEKAEALYVRLLKRKDELEAEFKEVFKPWFAPKGKVASPKRDNQRRGVQAGCSYQNIQLVEFNPGSRQHIAKVLRDKYAWRPVDFTASGQPQVNESILSELDYPEARLLTEYLTITKRLGQLADGDKAWLKLVTPKRRIHGEVITNGAVTGRMTHSNPNVAQVPKASSKVPYGRECRELFEPSPGMVEVGCDASGLELRCLAHYMARWDEGVYVKELLEGDIHTANQNAAGLPTRDDAKTFIYAFLYGAGDAKIGSIIGKGAGAGRKLKQQFLKMTPAIRELKEAVESAVKKRGHLVGLDGRHLKIRSLHSALNTLLQSAGALVMKKALVILDAELQKKYKPGVDYEFIANIHDEFQLETRPDLAEVVGQAAVDAIKKAGECFGFRCPLDGEYKIGTNWAECH